MNPTIGFIGGGRVTRIFLKAFKKAGLQQKITVSDINTETLSKLKDEFNVNITSDNKIAYKNDIVFFALHKKDILKQAENLRENSNKNLIVITLAPGITVKTLEELLGLKKIIRMTPNAPAAIGKGYCPVYYSPEITQEDKKIIEKLFSPLGLCPEVDENVLEAYSVITAMGPTYFWFQWIKLVEISMHLGIDEKQSFEAVKYMIQGAAELLFSSEMNPTEVMDLIPVKPLLDKQGIIENILSEKMELIYSKLKGDTR
jgi:pyrroline-5-carboxylate reductase